MEDDGQTFQMRKNNLEYLLLWYIYIFFSRCEFSRRKIETESIYYRLKSRVFVDEEEKVSTG